MVIIVVCMMGVYGVIQVVSKHFLEPQEMTQALNAADYYRDQLLAVTKESCEKPNQDIAPLVEHMCQHSPKTRHRFSLDALEGFKGWSLQADLLARSDDLYLITIEIKRSSKLILKTQFLKEAR